MRTLGGLFGKSPFGPIQAHVSKVRACVEMLEPTFKALVEGDLEGLRACSRKINELEREADEIKNEFRESLPRTLFLPAARSDLLVLIDVQDSIADAVQDTAALLRVRKLSLPAPINDELLLFVGCVCRTNSFAASIFDRLQDLLEGGFRGKPVTDVFEAIKEVGTSEHEADELAMSLMTKLFNLSPELPVPDLIIWDKVLRKLGNVADFSRSTANRMRIILAR